MATTRRESTARLRSEAALELVGSNPIPALGSGPHYSTADEAIRQGLDSPNLPIREPMISCIASAVDIAHSSHLKTHGSTVSLVHGNMAGEKAFAVSIYPARAVELRTSPTWQQFFAFALANADLLLKPAHALGSWRDDDRRANHVLDVVVFLSDRNEALDHGLRYGQRTIYDLEAGRVIAVPHPLHGFATAFNGGEQ